MSQLERLPISPYNASYLSIPEIDKDREEGIVPKVKIESFRDAFLTPTNHLFVKGKYVPTGLITPFDNKKLARPKQWYLYFKFKLLKKHLRHKGQFLFAHDSWSNNYYHWLCETLPRVYELHLHNPTAKFILPNFLNKLPFVLESLQLLHIDYILIDDSLSHLFEELSLIHTNPPLPNNLPGLQHQLKNALIEKLNIDVNTVPERKIYISRANARYRKILNEPEIMEMLNEYGFEALNTENLSFSDQINVFVNTKVLLSMHGAGHTNIMFMKKGTVAIEIRQQAWSAHPFCFFRIANIFDIEWHYIQGSSQGVVVTNFTDIYLDKEALKVFLKNLKL